MTGRRATTPRSELVPDVKKKLPGLILLLILATIFWRPALFAHKTIIHGDSIVHGLPLLDLQSRALHDLGRLLWSDETYGGHPLFAESQGGFANPVNMLFAWVVTPLSSAIYAMNLFHWFCMIASGLGVACLCRTLRLSPWASGFAAIAVVFSPIWIGAQQNYTISGALIWAPWIIWAVEKWLAGPNFASAALLGLMGALEVFSGYPQVLHGTLIYAAVLVLARLASNAEGRATRRAVLWTAAIAAGVGVGVSAMQWLPLLELTSLSHRSDGVAIPFRVPAASYLRGFLYTIRIEGAGLYFPVVGSLLVTASATLLAITGLASRLWGHLAAALLLCFLGFEWNTGLFSFLYEHGLIPGLHYFRTVHIYFNIAIIAIAVLAAAGIDGICRLADDRGNPALPARRVKAAILGAAAIALLWAWAVAALHLPQVRVVQYGTVAAAIIGGTLLVMARRQSFLPILMALLLAGECANIRLHEYHFAPVDILREPESVAMMEARPDWKDFKIYEDSLASAFGFVHPQSPDLEYSMRHTLASATGLLNLMWDLPSMDGALALPLRRRTEIDPLIKDEIYGKSQSPPGLRLIDMLANRYVVLDAPLSIPTFHTFWRTPPDSVWIVENEAARPRFQIYARAIGVDSTEAALAALRTMRTPTLVVEDAAGLPAAAPRDADAGETAGQPRARFTVLKARSTAYRFKISADEPVWFFIADANYPGWRAYLDGAEVPVLSAQVLGKAVAVPPGEHELRVAFRSRAFLWGAWISGASLLLLTLAALRRRLSPRHV